MTVPSLKTISRLLAAILFSIFLSSSPARSEAVTSVLGAQAANFTCGEIKDMAQKVPERLFKMWANSGTIGTHSAAAVQLIQAGNVQWLLENIGDVTLAIQILEEAAFGTVENSLKILSKALVTKSFTAVMDIVGKGGAYGPAAAIIFTCETLYAFGDYLSAESLDKNLETYAKLSKKNPAMLDINYFQKTYLGWDGKNWSDEINKKEGWREMYARRNSVVEYANRKLLNPKFPQISDWHNNVNVVRTTIHLIIKDVKDILEKERKFKQLQEELKTKLAALKQQHAALTTFQALRNQILAMTCQDTASKDCMSVYNLVLSTLQDLVLDAGDMKATASGVLDDIKSRLISLSKLLESIDQRVDDDYKARVEQYCTTVTTRLKTLEVTLSSAKSANAEIAARAVMAKGFRDRACQATDPVQAKAAADAAGKAANEAFLIFSAIPLLPKDLDNYIAPEAIDFAGPQAEMAGIEEQLSSLAKTINENFKKWEAFKKATASARKQLKDFNSTCGKNDVIAGVAAAIMAGRFEGQIQQVESQVPDIRYEKNMLDGFSRRLVDIRTFMGSLETRYQKYRECLSKVPDTGNMVSEAAALMGEGKSQLELAEKYAAEAKACLGKIECQSDNDCTGGKICQNGKCVCKPGYEEKNGNCVPVCGPNEKLDDDGNCVCKDGFVKQDGKCVEKAPDVSGGYFISGPSVVTVGEGVTFTAVEKNGAPHTGGTFSWFTSDSSIMSLGRTGVSVSGATFKPGTCTIVLSGTGSPGGLAVTHTLTIKPECAADDACPAGKICQNGRCIDDPNLCTSDVNCPVGKICRDGKCIDDPNRCGSNADCQPNHACINGKCVYQKPSGCQSDDDCDSGYVCNKGKCGNPMDEDYTSFTGTQTDRNDQHSQNQADQAANDQNTAQSGYTSDNLNQDLTNVQGQVSKECYRDSDCASGFHCEDGICVKTPGCSSDSDCGADQVCQSGNCVAKPQPTTQPTQQQPAQQTPATPDTLAVSPPNKVITKTESVALKAILTKGDGTTQDVTGQASWSPSATFSSSQIGNHTVTATYNSLSATAAITVVEEKGLGDITVSEKTITVTFWDHGQEDGDMIDININGKAVFSGITLTKAPQSRTITLTAGALVFGFTALNEGRVSPNTATVKFSSVTTGKAEQKYTLKKNAKANMNITYTPK